MWALVLVQDGWKDVTQSPRAAAVERKLQAQQRKQQQQARKKNKQPPQQKVRATQASGTTEAATSRDGTGQGQQQGHEQQPFKETRAMRRERLKEERMRKPKPPPRARFYRRGILVSRILVFVKINVLLVH